MSNRYLQLWEQAFGQMEKADDEKGASGMQWNYTAYGPGGANFWQSHDPSVLYGPF
jgi:hypothetical protein